MKEKNKQTEWYKKSVVYQIYPRSFKDSNNDGIGDIPGIISKLDYLADLGIDVIWLSPVYASPNFDYGYDISDYMAINPEYGTMKDMDNLIKEAKRRNIKIIMDLVINHTSSEHKWFKESKNRNAQYRDYYYWVEKADLQGKKKLPNNWTGFFSTNVWEEHDDAFYLHMFAKEQPDLNYHNPKVLQEIKDIMHFWLKKGIKGFRCDVINILYKESLEDGKFSLALRGMEHYLSTEGCHKIIRELRKYVLDEYDCFTVGETVMSNIKKAKDLSDEKRYELNMVFGFEHLEVDNFLFKWIPRKFKPKRLMRVLSKWQNEIEWNANFFENHDQPRIVSRYSENLASDTPIATLFATLIFGLKGTPFIYEGQEIGMKNAPFTRLEQFKDIEIGTLDYASKILHYSDKKKLDVLQKRGRENARTPMQWDSTGGFSESAEPWMLMNPNCKKINVHDSQNNPYSVLNYYKKLIRIRKENEAILSGKFVSVLETKSIYAFERTLPNSSCFVILNFSSKEERMTIDLDGKVLISNYERLVVRKGRVKLRPYEAMIVEVC